MSEEENINNIRYFNINHPYTPIEGTVRIFDNTTFFDISKSSLERLLKVKPILPYNAFYYSRED